MEKLAQLMNDSSLAATAAQQAKSTREYLTSYRSADGFYSFSHNSNDSFDVRHTVFPAVAWWSGSLTLPQADAMFDAWAAPRFSTDWGTRSMEEGAETYDPLSYHHGSVWPLYTGWTALAEYRAGRPQAGFASLEQNAQLTCLQDPGEVTEVLLGTVLSAAGQEQLASALVVGCGAESCRPRIVRGRGGRVGRKIAR